MGVLSGTEFSFPYCDREQNNRTSDLIAMLTRLIWQKRKTALGPCHYWLHGGSEQKKDSLRIWFFPQ